METLTSAIKKKDKYFTKELYILQNRKDFLSTYESYNFKTGTVERNHERYKGSIPDHVVTKRLKKCREYRKSFIQGYNDFYDGVFMIIFDKVGIIKDLQNIIYSYIKLV